VPLAPALALVEPAPGPGGPGSLPRIRWDGTPVGTGATGPGAGLVDPAPRRGVPLALVELGCLGAGPGGAFFLFLLPPCIPISHLCGFCVPQRLLQPCPAKLLRLRPSGGLGVCWRGEELGAHPRKCPQWVP